MKRKLQSQSEAPVYNPLASNQLFITVKSLANELSLKPTQIRKKLRANSIPTKPVSIPQGWPPQYYWTPDDPELEEVRNLLSSSKED